MDRLKARDKYEDINETENIEILQFVSTLSIMRREIWEGKKIKYTEYLCWAEKRNKLFHNL